MNRLSSRRLAKIAGVTGVVVAGIFAMAGENGPQQPWSKWHVHDSKRPAPPIVTPGTASTPETPGKAPSDAIVLFDGTDLSKWQGQGGGDPTFKLIDGVAVASGPKYLESKEQFGDIQLHLEWAEPVPPTSESQGRGNSGVFLMGQFEVQVLDNYKNPTYPDGQCSAIYGQYPPEVNVCRPPGEWQSYDIIFHRPRYEAGKLVSPGYETVLQNGVLTQDHQRIEGPTGHMVVARYPEKSFPEKGPLALQFHGDAVRYRNIWVRPLEALEHQQQTGEVAEAVKPAESK